MDGYEDYLEFPEDYNTRQKFDSLTDIEEALMRVSSMEKKLEWYKNLKRNRVQSIDECISTLEARREMIENIISNTMEELCPDEKTIHFPSVAKVTKRSLKDEVVIADNEAFMGYVQKEGIRSRVMKEEFNNTMAKNAIKEILKENPDESIPGVVIETGRTSMSISFEKPKKDTIDEVEVTPKKTKSKTKSIEELVV